MRANCPAFCHSVERSLSSWMELKVRKGIVFGSIYVAIFICSGRDFTRVQNIQCICYQRFYSNKSISKKQSAFMSKAVKSKKEWNTHIKIFLRESGPYFQSPFPFCNFLLVSKYSISCLFDRRKSGSRISANEEINKLIKESYNKTESPYI